MLVVLGLRLAVWVHDLARDDGGAGRPTDGAYTWSASGLPIGTPVGAGGEVTPANELRWTPRGGPVPRADGYVMGSEGNDFLLPPMPPERETDIARRDSVFGFAAIQSCFWPGPKLRAGFYTTDPDDYGIENQLPDIGNTFSTAWFRIPTGAKIVLKGEFPTMRHWGFVTYTEEGTPRDGIHDVELDPDPGSFNPFRSGVRRDVTPRHYTFSIENGMPPDPRPRNTVYTLSDPGTAIAMHMRNYVPDRSLDWTGGVGVPRVELHLADGTVLGGEEACAATTAPLRGKQVPLTVSKKLWMALNGLPWRPADRTPARDFEVAAMQKFYNREHLILHTFFPLLPSDWLAVEKGGFWSNPATRYGYTYLSQAYGKVYVVHGKMPRTPRTWNGDASPIEHDVDMRYWSLCTVASPATGLTVDCVIDENVHPILDARDYYSVVVSRASERPANATEACGVLWLEYGHGDGIPGGSPDFGAIINRHTVVDTRFSHSWFSVTQPDREAEVMGEYLPRVLNLHDRTRFEALGCPVDTSRFTAMTEQPD